MAFPLIAAAVVGGARGIAGAIGNRKRSKQAKRQIRQAYEIAQRRLGTQQGDIRQNTLESLNARGVLNAGSAQDRPGQDRFDAEGRLGETGQANTLGGQTMRDLSDEFALERRDLWANRQNAIKSAKLEGMQGYINAALGAASTGQAVYNGLQGAPSSGPLTPEQSSAVSAPATLGSVGGPMTIRGAFGLSPLDGSGTPMVASPGTSVYDFHVSPEQR